MTQEVAVKSKATSLRNMLEVYKSEIAIALPRHVSSDRMLRMCMTSARKTPDLLDCTPESFLGAAIQSAQLGLEPDTPLGHAWLLPFKNQRTGTKEVNFMPGYRGYLDLIYRVAEHPILNPVGVYEVDKFEWERGTSPFIKHIQMPREQRHKMTHVYVTARFPDGRIEFDVMTLAEIEAIRARSKATGFTPWKTDHESMSKKTIIRRFCKYLPMSAELQRAIGLDDLADEGHSQDNHLWTNHPPQTKSERIQSKMDGSFDDDRKTSV